MSETDHRDLIVIGGGISGLVTAFYRARAGDRVTLIEASPRVGGAITTWREGAWIFEQGPNTVLENNPRVSELIEAADLGSEKLVAEPEAKRRYVWKGDALVPLPGGPGGFVKTPLFSGSAKLRLFKEPWIRPAPAETEETVAAFVRRRLGSEMLDYAVGPFVSGVYAGDPERLSMRWAVAKLYALEQEHGSLIRGAFKRKKGPAPGGKMFTFKDGLETLPLRLAEGVGDVRVGTRATSVDRVDDGFAVATTGGTLHAKQVVAAVPADVLALLLAPLSNGASHAFDAMPYAPLVEVALGYRREDVTHPLDGFGFLAPRMESLRILGCLFPSTIFRGRAPEGHVALMAFAGGRTDPAVLDLTDDDVHAMVADDLRRSVGATGTPVIQSIRRWPRAIPQYEVGHGRYVELASKLETENPGLFIAGNVLGGISVPDCIRKATELAEKLVAVSLAWLPCLPCARSQGDGAGNRADPRRFHGGPPSACPNRLSLFPCRPTKAGG